MCVLSLGMEHIFVEEQHPATETGNGKTGEIPMEEEVLVAVDMARRIRALDTVIQQLLFTTQHLTLQAIEQRKKQIK